MFTQERTLHGILPSSAYSCYLEPLQESVSKRHVPRELGQLAFQRYISSAPVSLGLGIWSLPVTQVSVSPGMSAGSTAVAGTYGIPGSVAPGHVQDDEIA